MKMRTMAVQNNDVPLTRWQKAFLSSVLDIMLVCTIGAAAIVLAQMIQGWTGWATFAGQLLKVTLAVALASFLISKRSYNDPLRRWGRLLWRLM